MHPPGDHLVHDGVDGVSLRSGRGYEHFLSRLLLSEHIGVVHIHVLWMFRVGVEGAELSSAQLKNNTNLLNQLFSIIKVCEFYPKLNSTRTSVILSLSSLKGIRLFLSASY